MCRRYPRSTFHVEKPTDDLGSVQAFADDSGSLTQPYQSEGTSTQPFQFTGQQRDAESSFGYLQARYYDPGTGQLISRVPLGSLTRAPCNFVDGAPLNAIDPSGLARITPAAPRANCGGTDGQCTSTAGGLFHGYVVKAPFLDAPMDVRITFDLSSST